MRPLALGFVFVLAGCAAGSPHVDPDAGPQQDAGHVGPAVDSGPVEDAGTDAATVSDAGGTSDAGGSADAGGGPSDGGTDGGPAMVDAGTDAGPGPMDAGTDAGTVIDAGTCSAASAGDTIALDGTDDAGKFASTQTLTPGALNQSWELFALTWDADYLYLAIVSQSFEADNAPLHVYIAADPTLSGATPSSGKEYGGLTAQLPFTATHLLAVRRVSDLGGLGRVRRCLWPRCLVDRSDHDVRCWNGLLGRLRQPHHLASSPVDGSGLSVADPAERPCCRSQRTPRARRKTRFRTPPPRQPYRAAGSTAST